MASFEQDDEDACIVWENPDTPAKTDDFIFVHGKRFVRPYYFEFVAYVKKRWAGKIIVDFYAKEFKGRPPEYYVEAVKRGRILVDGRRVAPSFVVHDGQKMSHFVHRHEPPVMAESVKILEEGPDVITVCKPASIPVHPCGQYRKNTVVGILEAENNTGQLFPIHRLDRLVSGLLILARNSQTANLFREEIEAGRVYKQYVAKVSGVFPAHKVEVNADVTYDPQEGISSVETGQSGIGKRKTACTRFQRLSTNGVFSIVRCEPVTGRTHQIRVHLQYLGHPIANDSLYMQAHPPKRSIEGVSADTAAKAARNLPPNVHDTTIAGVGGTLRSSVTEKSTFDTVKDECSKHKNSGGCSTEPVLGSRGTALQMSPLKMPIEKASDQVAGNGHQFSVDVMCTHCPSLGPSGYKTEEDGLWLHCVRYTSPSWAYDCPLPDWAL